MQHPYLSYKFEDSPAFVNTFDEAPLWSAAFGLLLFKHLELKPDMQVLDLGPGAGFPLLELAQRLGSSCTCYGLDPWANANNRAKEKITNYGIANASIIEGSGNQIPFGDATIDLIVSNLGINNFEQPEVVFKECHRVLKPGGRLVLTTNLNGHWKEFYAIFEDTLQQLGHHELLTKLKAQQEHRGTIASIENLFTASGLKVTRTFEDSFTMRFLDGTAMLNHYFVKLGWLSSWLELVPAELHLQVFPLLEQKLNTYAAQNGNLVLTVPMAYIEGVKS